MDRITVLQDRVIRYEGRGRCCNQSKKLITAIEIIVTMVCSNYLSKIRKAVSAVPEGVPVVLEVEHLNSGSHA